MPNSSPSPPPPPPATTLSPSKKRLLTFQNSNQGLQNISMSNCLPQKDKRTRDLPNLSGCHGCGVRINYGNPKERLQLLESVWRIVLLCRKCIKLVNSGQICPYCFGDTVNFVSDCVKCGDCERSIHKNCIVKYNNSAPWSYSCKEPGIGFSVCVDCWVPNLMKKSVRICRNKEKSEKSGGELCSGKGDSWDLRMEKNGIISLQEVVKDANSAVENKIAFAIKAKEKALRKTMVAKNAELLANNAMDLVPQKECSSKKSEGLAINSGSNVNEATRFVDDAELAFQFHRAMNSSPRNSQNTCSVNVSCSDILKLTDSLSVSPKSNDLGSVEGIKVAAFSNSLANRSHDCNILQASACIRTTNSGSAISSSGLKPELKTYKRNNKKRKECQENVENVLEVSACMRTSDSGPAVISSGLKPELKTYKRNNKKRKECQENVENGYVGNTFGVAGDCPAADDRKIDSEPQSCQSDELKQEFHVNDARASNPESCNTDIVIENSSGNTRPDRYAIKYCKRMAGCRDGLYIELNFTHEEADSHSVSFQKEIQASAPGLPTDCSTECRAFSDSSLHFCIVNLRTCASIGGSSQEEG